MRLFFVVLGLSACDHPTGRERALPTEELAVDASRTDAKSLVVREERDELGFTIHRDEPTGLLTLCSMTAPATAVAAAEEPAVADLVDIDATWATHDWFRQSPEMVLTMMARGLDAARRRILSATEAAPLWAEYRAARTRPRVDGSINTREIVRFRTTFDAERWIAIDQQCTVVMTEDHACYRVAPALLRAVVDRVPGAAVDIRRIGSACSALL